MIATRPCFVEGIGTFVVPNDTPEHSDDGEKCVRSVCGRYEPDIARLDGEWGIGVIYAYDPNPGCAEMLAMNLRLVQRGVAVQADCSAVTAEANPVLTVDACWGRSSTHDALNAHPDSSARERIQVHAVHPRDLPAVDAMKLDAEGAESDIIDHYPHWNGVLVLMIEWHTHEAREKMRALAERQGWRLAKDDCGDEAIQGVACYVRPR